jgi:hypothetical protein
MTEMKGNDVLGLGVFSYKKKWNGTIKKII